MLSKNKLVSLHECMIMMSMSNGDFQNIPERFKDPLLSVEDLLNNTPIYRPRCIFLFLGGPPATRFSPSVVGV